MALITKTNKTIKDPFNGDIATSYTNTKQFQVDLVRGATTPLFETYNKKESRTNGSLPIHTGSIVLPISAAMRALLDQVVAQIYVESLLLTESIVNGMGVEVVPIQLSGAPITDFKSDEV